MTIRVLLLSSVALIATETAPLAAPSARVPDWYFAAEGAALFTNPTVFTTIPSPPTELGNETGGSGALTLGGAIDADHDWRIRLGVSAFDNQAKTTPGWTYELTSHYAITTADFEAGYRRASEAGEFRFGAGLRALAVSEVSTEDKVGTGDADYQLNSEFAGLGPRVSLGYTHHTAATPWGWSGSLAAAAIFGRRDMTPLGITTPLAGSGAQTVFNAEGAIGLDYRASPSSLFTVGLRAEQWWNLRGESSDSSLTVKSNVANWGPFIRWTAYAP